MLFINPFLHMIYAYMVGNIHFICLIQIQNTEIYTAFFWLNQPKNTNIWIFADITQP